MSDDAAVTEFRETSPPGGPWAIEVIRLSAMPDAHGRGKRQLAGVMGHIRRRSLGDFAFFPIAPYETTPTPSLWDDDLEALKEKIRVTPWRLRLRLEKP